MHGQSKQSRLRRSSTKHIWELLKTTLIQSSRGAYILLLAQIHICSRHIYMVVAGIIVGIPGFAQLPCPKACISPTPGVLRVRRLRVTSFLSRGSRVFSSHWRGFYGSVWGSGFRLRGFGLWGGEDTFRSNPSVNALSRTEPSLS